MKRSLATATLVPAVALLFACGGGCLEQLSGFCTECPTLEELDTQVREEIRTETDCFYAARGTCGDLEFISVSGGYGGPTWFFDESGTLVAAEKSSDTNEFCNQTSFQQHYGYIPDCAREVTEDLCESENPAAVQQRLLLDLYQPAQSRYIEEYGVHIVGTAGVSPEMLPRVHDLILHMLDSLADPRHQVLFEDHYVLVITDDDPEVPGGVPGQRNTGSAVATVINEALVCQTSVDSQRPDATPVYRGWDTPIHEFGHSLEDVLQLGARSDAVFSRSVSSYDVSVAREYFAWTMQAWFDSEQDNGTTRADLGSDEREYFATIFRQDDSWRPSCG